MGQGSNNIDTEGLRSRTDDLSSKQNDIKGTKGINRSISSAKEQIYNASDDVIQITMVKVGNAIAEYLVKERGD